MSIWKKFRSVRFLVFVFFIIFFSSLNYYTCFASETDPLIQKYNKMEITESKGVKYFDKAKFWEKEGIHIVYLEGTPFEMGYQQGRLLKEYIRNNAKYSNMVIEKLGNSESLQKNLKKLEKTHPPEFIEEIKGIAAGSEVPYDSILRHNFLSILWALKKQNFCSNFAAFNGATVDQKIIFFNTFDWEWTPYFNVLLLRRPSTGNGFVTMSEAGSIHAAGYGLNEKGLSVGHTGILFEAEEYYSDEGIGKFMLHRKILQYASSIEDVQKIISAITSTAPGIYLVVDGKTKEGKVFEFTSKGFKTRSPENNFLGSTNHFTMWTNSRRKQESEDRLWLIENFNKKYYGKIDLNKTIAFLRQENIAKINPRRGIITRSMMLCTPENLNFWIAWPREKNVPASWGPLVGFNLLKELGKGNMQIPDPVTFPPGKE
jgi:predicted choloylglycine hydrolase